MSLKSLQWIVQTFRDEIRINGRSVNLSRMASAATVKWRLLKPDGPPGQGLQGLLEWRNPPGLMTNLPPGAYDVQDPAQHAS